MSPAGYFKHHSFSKLRRVSRCRRCSQWSSEPESGPGRLTTEELQLLFPLLVIRQGNAEMIWNKGCSFAVIEHRDVDETSPHSQVFEHLVPSWWCFGEGLGGAALAGGSMSLDWKYIASLCFCLLSLLPSCL